MGKSINLSEYDYNVANNECGTLTQVVGRVYDGHDISISQVKNALGEGTTALGELCSSGNINKWAAFKSGRWNPGDDNMQGQFNWLPSIDGFRLGDFLGYNHNAKAPIHYAETLPATLEIELGMNAAIAVKLQRGESIPVNPQASKNYVDVQSVFRLNAVTHNKKAVTTLGDMVGSTQFDVYIEDTEYEGTGTLLITPYYYDHLDADTPVSMIEGGSKSIEVTIVPCMFTAILTKTPTGAISGDNPQEVQYNWSITRTGEARTMYFRIRSGGTNAVIPNPVVDLGILAFTQGQTRTGSAISWVEAAMASSTYNVDAYIEASTMADFSYNVYQIAQLVYQFTNPIP